MSLPAALPVDPWDWAHEQWQAMPPAAQSSSAGRQKAPRRKAPTSDELHGDARTTAPITPEDTAREWMADLEHVCRVRFAPIVRGLDERAKRLRRRARDLQVVIDDMPIDEETSCVFQRRKRRERERECRAKKTAAAWAAYRARALSMSRAAVVGTCGLRWRAITCGCGTFEMQVGCDNTHLCPRCRKRHWRKWRNRITTSMELHLASARSEWLATPRHRRRGKLPGIYLVTLTAPHSGDIEQDRAALGEGWTRFRKTAHAEHWWKTFVLTWEVTPGKSGTPHVHAHVAVISSWLPFTSEYAELGRPGLREAWEAAMPGARVMDIQAPKSGANAVGRAANYLAKYVTKGIEPSELSGRDAGALIVAFRNRRKVTTSAKFWDRSRRPCVKCDRLHVTSEHPCSLQTIAPGAVLSAWSERIGMFVERGPRQVALRYDDG